LKKLIDILDNIKTQNVVGDADIEIQGITDDSRNVKPGYLFVAVKGVTVNGHDYIAKAIENGASGIVVESDIQDEQIVVIQVDDSQRAKGRIAQAYFDYPSKQLKLIGVTGTNGKSTIATILFNLFEAEGKKTGLISTIEYKVSQETFPSTHTTPDVLKVYEILNQMVKAGCSHAVMEVSSHAIDQKRIEGLQFDCAVFTNLTHDHINYHGSFDNYREAKKKLFDSLGSNAYAIVNVDDPNGQVMVQNTKARILEYSLRKMADYKAKIISNTIEGLELEVNDVNVHLQFVGMFNAYNLLAVYAVADKMLENTDSIMQTLSGLRHVEGRFDLVRGEKKKLTAIVDYAHTPDALENVLKTIKQVKRKKASVVTVVGCGGDRDVTKRPRMAKIAQAFSDVVILTSDNPRTEDPEKILDMMEAGLEEEVNNVVRITDRKIAIQTATMMASEGDIILVAGKGHEKYQDINGVKSPFDDKQILRALLG